MDYTIDLIEIGTKRRSGKKIDRVEFSVAHDVGIPDSTARNNVDFYKRTANDKSASAHIFVDDKEAIMCIPAFENAEKAWHVRYNTIADNELFGDDSNDVAIGVELCYYPEDYERSLQAYKNYVDVFVDLFIFHDLPPSEITAHMILDTARRTDPNNALQHIDKDCLDLFNDVEELYFKRIKPYDDYTDILEECLDDPESMIIAIEAIKDITELPSDLGDIEQLKYVDLVFEKVFDYAYKLGKESKQ